MIPRILHHIWVGPAMPDHLARYVQTWRDLHPTWEHRLWGEDDLTWLTNQRWFDQAERLAPGSEGQLRSDLARYEILHRHGGVYVDCDMEALRPIDGLLETGCFAAREDDLWVNNAILGCVPGHRLMSDLIAAAPGSIRRNRGRRPNRMTGPHLLTPRVGPDVTVHPREMFYPYRWDELDAQGPWPDAYAVHHWNNARRRACV